MKKGSKLALFLGVVAAVAAVVALHVWKKNTLLSFPAVFAVFTAFSRR